MKKRFICLTILNLIILLFAFQTGKSTDSTTKIADPNVMPTPGDVVHDLDLWPVFEELEVHQDINCEMPCWWRLRPGITTISEVIEFLEQTGFDRHKQRTIYHSLPMEEYLRGGELFGLRFEHEQPRLNDFEINFSFNNDALLLISIRFTQPVNWLRPELDRVTFGRMLAQFPESPEFYIFTDENLEVDSRYISLLLISDTNGIKANYVFEDNNAAENLQLCLGRRETKEINLTLQDPQHERSVSQSIRNSIEPTQGSGYRRLEEVFGIDTATFIQYFKDHPDGCFKLDMQQN